MPQPETIKIPLKKMEQIAGDAEATAKAINLVYVNDSMEGITRQVAGKKFRYLYKNRPVKNKADLARIKSLVIPPAWGNVWICTLENGHLQATGLDVMKRKQYKYHPSWNKLRNETKFYRMEQFGKALPVIRKKIMKDLSLPGMPKEKVLAAVLKLMETTSIRIGNESYEKLYGSFGLTTLKNRHVNISGSKVKFSFKGKKGVEHAISIRSKKLAKIVKHCRDIPGKELFQYYDTEGNKQSIDSGMVNDYIRNMVEADFTSKDFRTWAGTVQALTAFRDIGNFETAAEAKKKIVEVLDKVSQHLGNTRTVCKKYYVHPVIVEMYESSHLNRYFDPVGKGVGSTSIKGLSAEEKLLMRILAKIKNGKHLSNKIKIAA